MITQYVQIVAGMILSACVVALALRGYYRDIVSAKDDTIENLRHHVRTFSDRLVTTEQTLRKERARFPAPGVEATEEGILRLAEELYDDATVGCPGEFNDLGPSFRLDWIAKAQDHLHYFPALEISDESFDIRDALDGILLALESAPMADIPPAIKRARAVLAKVGGKK